MQISNAKPGQNELSRCIRHNVSYLVLAVLIAAITPFIGSEPLDYKHIINDITQGQQSSVDTDIFINLRIPRLLVGFMAGGTLAIVGSTLQSILRNPLASPYTLGVTGGAAVGAYLAIAFPSLSISFGPFCSIQIFAIIGSLTVTLLIFLISHQPKGISVNILLLAGVTIGILCGAIVLLIRYISSPTLLVSMDRWIMGAVDSTGFRDLATILPFLIPSIGILIIQANNLNHISLGEEMAMGHGVETAKVQRCSFLVGSLATAAVVSVTGPIGFIGLLVPHVVKKISGHDHRIVLPASFLLGGSTLAACDTIARTIAAPTEIPVGIITALIGGPFFIYLLAKRQ